MLKCNFITYSTNSATKVVYKYSATINGPTFMLVETCSGPMHARSISLSLLQSQSVPFSLLKYTYFLRLIKIKAVISWRKKHVYDSISLQPVETGG